MEGGLKRKELKCSETGAFFTPPINWRKGAISWGLVIKSKVIYIDLSRPFLKGLKHIFIEQCSGEGNGTPLQYSCLENPMDGGAWEAAVHVVAKSWTRLSDFTFTFHFHALEKEMATHSSVLAWGIPEMGEPSGLPSMGVAQSQIQPKWLSSSSRVV